jgi:hypothetical protein
VVPAEEYRERWIVCAAVLMALEQSFDDGSPVGVEVAFFEQSGEMVVQTLFCSIIAPHVVTHGLVRGDSRRLPTSCRLGDPLLGLSVNLGPPFLSNTKVTRAEAVLDLPATKD